MTRLLIALLMASTMPARAQDGAAWLAVMDGAAASTFVPTDIAGLQVWLDASVTGSIYTNASGVTNWMDQSGNGRNFAEADITREPTLAYSQNSILGLSFDGGNDRLVGPNNAFARAAEAKTIYVVARKVGGYPVTYVNGSIFQHTASGSTGVGGNITGECGYRVNIRTWVSSTQMPVDSACLLVLSTTGAGNIHAVTSMRLNGSGVARTSGTDGALVNDTQAMIIAQGSPDSDTASFCGAVYEILFYSTAHATGQVAQVEAYLTAKWGL